MEAKYVRHIKDLSDAGFNPVEAAEPIIKELDVLCQLMFDPENQPPQMTTKEAWERYRAISSSHDGPSVVRMPAEAEKE